MEPFMSIPVVNLADPSREPTDAELEALMRSVRDKAVERQARAQERFMATLAEMVARAGQDEVGRSLSGSQTDEGPGPDIAP